MKSTSNRWQVKPGTKVDLRRVDAGATPGCKGKRQAERDLADALDEMRHLQYRLYAEGLRAVLVVLQGMDASGKDGVVRHVFSGLNPQGCRVTSFKAPTEIEKAHDFLWRIHQPLPAFGEIGVFNRSHYEDVLIARVRGIVPEKVWRPRYEQINAFERHLTDNGIVLIKCFLHITSKEQKRRLLKRLDDPERNWKFAAADIDERAYWDAYQDAYAEAMTRCGRTDAPWHIIPADRKWYRNWAVAMLLRDTLTAMAPRFPNAPSDIHALRRRLRRDKHSEQ